MEFNQDFISGLQGKSRKIPLEILSDEVFTLREAFKVLLKFGQQGENAYIEWGGKKYYSFMSEDEMHRTAFGQTKAEYEEKRGLSRGPIKLNEEALQTKQKLLALLPEWKKVLMEAGYSEDKARDILTSAKEQAENNHLLEIREMSECISMLTMAKNNPDEATKRYSYIDDKIDQILAGSNCSEVFKKPIGDRIKEECRGWSEEAINREIKRFFADNEKSGAQIQTESQLGE